MPLNKKYKNYQSVIKEIFPHAHILDSALEFPIREDGWAIDIPHGPDYYFTDDHFHLFVNLQDMLTGRELLRLHDYFAALDFPMNRITVLCWPRNIQKILPPDSFNVITFSSHQYETWCTYKSAEDVLREEFGADRKRFEYNFVCPQRIYKPHRAALHSTIGRYPHGNTSLQSKGVELRYPSLSFADYDLTYDNLSNLLAMKENYNTALFSIVSESQYREKYGIITEKTFNSIVAGMPFLLCSHRFGIQDVTEYGFVTYPHFFDEHYDGIDNQVRIKFMLELNQKLIKNPLSAVEMQTYYDELSPTIEYNRNYFFEQFGDQLISELRMDLLNIWGT